MTNPHDQPRGPRWLPGLGELLNYRSSWLRADVLAGATVWAMLVPQALGYASLAGMPTVNGLYAAVGALVVYWLWGSSRDLNVGPESTVAIMMAAILSTSLTPGSDEYVANAAMLGILVGLVLIVGGLFRIGRIADFLSRPVLAGYVFGSGVLIVVSQLPDLLGLSIDASLYLTELGGVIRNLGETHWPTFGVGLATVGIVVAFRRWVPAIPGALVALVLFIGVVAATGLEVAVVGEFPSGIPVPAIPDLAVAQIIDLIGPAFAIALLVYPDSVLTGRSLAVVGDYRLDANREFFGIGAANIGAGILGGFPVNGSQSRSFVASDAGAKSQVSNLFAAALVILTLLFLSPLFANLPSAVLAGIVLVAGWALLEVSEFRRLWSYRRTEFWMATVTVVAVLGIGMLAGIIVAVALSLASVVLRSAAPHTAVLGRLPGTDTYRGVDDHPDAIEYPGLVIYRFDAPLFFANAGTLRDEILIEVNARPEKVERVIIDLESTPDIDSSGAQVLAELFDSLESKGADVALARVRTDLQGSLAITGLDQRLGGDGVYLEVGDAVADWQQMVGMEEE